MSAFGMGYAEATMLHAGILLERRTFSPEGDAPVVIDEVTVENQGNTPRSLRHYEIWDVGRRPIEINWTVSGIPFALAPATAATARDERNGLFEEAITWEPDERVLGLRRAHAAGVTAPPRADPSEIDHYPGDPFVVALVGDVADVYTDQAAFFGNGGVASPAAVGARAPGQIWPAISALLTWGHAREDPDLGWGHLVRNTMAAHAVSYPEIWYGIWIEARLTSGRYDHVQLDERRAGTNGHRDAEVQMDE